MSSGEDMVFGVCAGTGMEDMGNDQLASGLIHKSAVTMDPVYGTDPCKNKIQAFNGVFHGRSCAVLYCEVCAPQRELFLQYGLRYFFDACDCTFVTG